MMTGALLVMAMQLLPAPALPRWRVLGRNAQVEYAVDPQSVERHWNRVRAVVRLRAFNPPPGMQAVTVTRYVYQCRTRTVSSEASDFYAIRGRFIGTLQTPANELRDEPFQPASPNGQVWAHLCGRARH